MSYRSMYTRREPIERIMLAMRMASMRIGAYHSLEMAELYLDNLARNKEQLEPREREFAKLHSTVILNKGVWHL